MGASTPEYWTEAEKNFVRDNAGILKDKDILIVINRMRLASGHRITSLEGVRKIRAKLGIVKAQGKGVSRVVSRPPEPPKPSVALAIEGSENPNG